MFVLYQRGWPHYGGSCRAFGSRGSASVRVVLAVKMIFVDEAS